jgi:outer membrane protein TolC
MVTMRPILATNCLFLLLSAPVMVPAGVHAADTESAPNVRTAVNESVAPNTHIYIHPLIFDSEVAQDLFSQLQRIRDGRAIQLEGKPYVAAPTEPNVEFSLQQVIQIALADNKELQISKLAPEAAKLNQSISRTAYDPTLFSDAGYFDTNRPVQSLLDTGRPGSEGDDSLLEEGWDAQAGLRQPIPTGGDVSLLYEADHLDSNSDLTIPNPQYTSRVRFELRQSLLKGFADPAKKSSIELSDISYSQATAEFQQSVNDVLRELALYYWRYKYYHQLEQISIAAVEDVETILQRLETRFDQGLANQLDLDRTVASLQDKKLRLLADRKLAQTTLNQLKEVIGISPRSELFLLDFIPSEPFLETVTLPERTVMLETAETRRGEISRANQAVSAATVRLKLARHLQLPTLDARTSYALNGLGEDFSGAFDGSMTSDHPSWDVGLFLEWPIGGRKASLEALKSNLDLRKEEINYLKTLEQVAYEVNTYLGDVKLSEVEISTALKAQEAYGRVLEHNQTLFELSRIDNRRLLDSQDDYYIAQRKYLNRLLDLNISFLRLQWSQGLMLEHFGLPFTVAAN